MKMSSLKSKRSILIIVALTGLLLLGAEYRNYYRVAGGSVSFFDYCEIRGAVLCYLISDALETKSIPEYNNARIVRISTHENSVDGAVDVMTGKNTGWLKGAGRMFVLRKRGWIWKVITESSWQA